MKKAIVTGATGFIGSSFVQFLVDKGIDVVALGRKPLEDVRETRRQKIEGAHYINLDMKEIENLDKKIAEINWDAGKECVFF